MNKDFWKNHFVLIVGVILILVSIFGGLGEVYAMPLMIGVLMVVISAIMLIRRRAGLAEYVAHLAIGLLMVIFRGFFRDYEVGMLFGFGIILITMICFLIGSAVKNKKKSSN